MRVPSGLLTLATLLGPAALFSVPAQAAVYTVGFTGVLDTGGYFLHDDLVQYSLVGEEYRIEFTVDDSKVLPASHAGYTYSTLFPVSLKVTAGAFSFDGGATPYSQFLPNRLERADTASGNDSITGGTEDTYPDTYYNSPKDGKRVRTHKYAIVTAGIAEKDGLGTLLDSSDLGAPLSRPVGPTDLLYVSFYYIDYEYDPNTGQRIEYNEAIGTASTGTFFTTRVGPSVPEPATWSTMLGGLGLLGAAARRRKRSSFTYA